MDIRGDVLLRYTTWEKADQLLNFKDENSVGIFGRMVDLFIVACSIGILLDETIPNNSEKEFQTIGRNTYITNDDISRIFTFMFENAILTSKKVNFDIETRMKIAFDSGYINDKFSPINFLIEFANYGIDKIFDQITNHDIEAITNLVDYLQNLLNPEFTELSQEIAKDLDKIDFNDIDRDLKQ